MKQTIYILIALFYFGFIACEEPIDIELGGESTNRLVVDGSISNQYKIHTVTLSRTAAFMLNERTPRVLDAIVTITDGDTLINLYDTNNDGTYETDKELAGKPDHVYTLNITLENGEEYSATDTLHPIAPLDSLIYQYKKSDEPFTEDHIYALNIYVQEPPEPDQYYQWEYLFDGISQTDTIRAKRFESDYLVNGTYFGKSDDGDDTNDNGWTVFELEEYQLEKEEVEVTVQMLSITKEKFDFNLAVLLETDYSGTMFSGPPANIPTNVTNGGMGFFSASAVTERTVTIKKVGELPNR